MEAVAERPGLILSAAELKQLTGDLTQPAAQLRELHKQGFVRAYRPRGGAVVLTRAHYEAVQASRPSPEPTEQEQNARTGPNVVGLNQWTKNRKQHGPQTQGR